MPTALQIKDGEDVLFITYESMLQYHGREFIGGVALAYKLLELAFDQLAHGIVPARGQWLIRVGVYGPGIIDGLEMATRALTRGGMMIQPELSAGNQAPDAADGRGGKYYFEMVYGGRQLNVTLKEGLLPGEFLQLAGKTHDGTISVGERQRLQELKAEIARFLLTQKPEALFDYQCN